MARYPNFTSRLLYHQFGQPAKCRNSRVPADHQVDIRVTYAPVCSEPDTFLYDKTRYNPTHFSLIRYTVYVRPQKQTVDNEAYKLKEL